MDEAAVAADALTCVRAGFCAFRRSLGRRTGGFSVNHHVSSYLKSYVAATSPTPEQLSAAATGMHTDIGREQRAEYRRWPQCKAVKRPGEQEAASLLDLKLKPRVANVVASPESALAVSH